MERSFKLYCIIKSIYTFRHLNILYYSIVLIIFMLLFFFIFHSFICRTVWMFSEKCHITTYKIEQFLSKIITHKVLRKNLSYNSKLCYFIQQFIKFPLTVKYLYPFFFLCVCVTIFFAINCSHWHTFICNCFTCVVLFYFL
jgi:hypothetical protein